MIAWRPKYNSRNPSPEVGRVENDDAHLNTAPSPSMATKGAYPEPAFSRPLETTTNPIDVSDPKEEEDPPMANFVFNSAPFVPDGL